MHKDETNTKELTSMLEAIRAVKEGKRFNIETYYPDDLEEGDKEEYQKFFNGMLDKYGVKSPAELSTEKKKEFFDAIEKGWTKEEEVKEAKKEPFTPFSKSDAFITKDRDAETGRGEFYNVRSGEGFKIIKTFKTMKDAEKFMDKMNEEYVTEASITTSTDFDDYPIDKQAKKFKLKVKKMPDEGDGINGYDLMTLTGSEKDIVSYFVQYMGANKKDTIKDLEQEFGESKIHEAYMIKHKNTGFLTKVGKGGTNKDGNLMFKPSKKGAVKYKDQKAADDAMAGMIKDYAPYGGGTLSVVKEEEKDPEEAYDRNKLFNKMMKPIKDKEKMFPKSKKPVKEEAGFDGSTATAQEPGGPGGEAARIAQIKALHGVGNIQVPDAFDANKAALSTFANIMNSVKAKGGVRQGDDTLEDPIVDASKKQNDGKSVA